MKTQFIVQSPRSSVIYSTLVDGVISVVVELLMPGVVFVGELSEKLTRSFAGVDLVDDPHDFFEVDLIELISVNMLIEEFWAESEDFLGVWKF